MINNLIKNNNNHPKRYKDLVVPNPQQKQTLIFYFNRQILILNYSRLSKHNKIKKNKNIDHD